MKKKHINIVMTVVSAAYLFFFIIVLIKAKVTNATFEIFDADGLAIIGGISALMELLISCRNKLSKWINSIIFFNKKVNYQITISFHSQELEIKDFIDIFETKICEYMRTESLQRTPTSKLMKTKWNLSYSDLGCDISCFRHVEDYSASSGFGMVISGNTKYGKINSRKTDILYMATLIKILANDYFTDSKIVSKSEVERIEIRIKKAGSQIALSNIFNDSLNNVENFKIKTLDGVRENEEVYLSDTEVKWTTLNSRTLMDGFGNLTDILCSIE